jgi:HK97 family phage major capsid protein
MKRLVGWGGLALTLIVVATVIAVPELLAHHTNTIGLTLAITATATTRDLKTILGDIDRIEKEYEGKLMPQDKGDELERLYTEGKALQDSADRQKRRASLESFSREIIDPALPGGKDKPATSEEIKGAKNRIAGYMRVGEFISNAPAMHEYAQKFKHMHGINIEIPSLLKIKSLRLSQGFIPLTKEMRDAIETKDLAVIGDGVIEPMRLADIVRDVENDQLSMRDVLNVSPTSAALIQWVARVGSPDRSAAIQSEGPTAATMAQKPQADAEYEVRETSVKTIAVWIPVTEQQLQDMPALINLIQQDLLWDLRKEEEEQMVWGDGTGLNLDGLDANITEADAGGYTSNIDLIRRSMTQIRVSGYQPTAVTLHPEDWEGIELEKGSDGHYIWAVIRDTLGPRIWGLRVVETVAMDDPDSTNRLIIVGDFQRGATLFDRMQASIAIGWQDKQFIQNLRTIRAEERVAFAVRRPDAFRKITVTA